MKHEEIEELLSAFYDDELEPLQKNLVTHHLQSCQNCHLILESWKKIKQNSFSQLPLQIQENFAEKVMAKIEEKTNPVSFPLFKLSETFSFSALKTSFQIHWKWLALRTQWKIALAISSLLFILLIPLERNPDIQEEPDSSEMLLENIENNSLQAENWLFSETEAQKEDFMEMIFEKHNKNI
ncbi:MAG: zf-HC2 domain-containing protein [Elusimicrobia bacterium]|nr:zf-HC2 domain-containing protein [Elusimicrobiota bacterium]